MDKTIIYRLINGIETIVAEVVNDKSTFYNVIMGKNEVVVDVVTESIINVTEGDYIHYNGIKYKLNRSPEFTDKSDVCHEYSFVFEHPFYTLIDKLLTNRITGSTKVVLTATLRDWAELIIWNVNKTADNPLGVDTGWTVGKVPDTEYKTIVFDAINCRDAVTEVSSAYGVEYYFDDHELNFVERIENPRDFVFTQGKGKGLYEIEQANVDDGDVTTRLFPAGGTDNVIPGEGDEEGRLILPEKYLENFSESARVVEKKVVFDEIHPTFTGIVEAPSGDDNREFTCPTIDFDVQELAVGDEARVNFLTGDLLGKSFEFKWDNEAKKITLIYQEDDLAQIDPETGTKPNVPSSDKYLRGGEKFNFTGIKLGESYKNAAIDKLREKGTQWLEYNCRKRVKFELSVDYRFMRGKGELYPGDLITIKLPSRNIEKLIRINSVEKNLRTGKLTCVVSNYLDEKWEDKIEGEISSMQATLNGGDAGNSNVDILTQYDGRPLTDKRVFSSLRSMLEFVSKKKDDIVQGVITFLKGISFGNFIKGSTGAGIYKDENENWHIEGDYFHIRKKLTAEEVQIQRNSHIGGKLMQTSASMSCIKVEELKDAYRCYMRTEDAEGRVIYNEFKPNDQANVETFNLQRQENGTLGNHFLWRLVIGVGIDYIDLSKSICAEGSDIPQVGDEIVQLGYRGTDDPNRQNAQVLAGAGTDSPYIKQYIGINSFTLPTEYTRLKPGDNLFTGVSHVQPGSTGAKNFSDLPEVIQEAADGMSFGKYNLLRNTGFTGDFLSKQLQEDTELNEGSAMFSPPLDHWDAVNVTVQDSPVSESGKEAVISSGNLMQTFFYKVMAGESYVLSFKAKGTSLTYSCGGVSKTIGLTTEYNRYVEKFTATSAGEIFSITGTTCTICEIQLERGTVVSAWGNSMLDNSSELAYYESLKYLQSAIHDASSTTLGGLNLANIMLVGNYVDGKMKEITGGISGVYNDENSVFAFGGGDLEAAIRCVAMFKDNPSYQPTDEELAGIAKIVLTHGGRAILNDVILRGYIYALGGRFQGEVIANSGVFKNISTPNKSLEIDEEGNVKGKDFELENVKASGTIEAGSGSKIGNMQILDGGATLGQNSSFINAHMVNIPYNAGVIDYSKTISGSITQFDTYLISNDMVDLFQMKLPSNDDIANSNSKLHGNGHTFRITIAVGNFYTNISKSIRLIKQGNMDFYDRNGNSIEYLDVKNGMCVMIQGIINIVSSSRKILYSIL